MSVGLKLTYYDNVSITRAADPTDEWDRDDTYTERGDFKLVLSEKYPDVYLDDAKLGDHVYLIFAEYSTGDSFGYDENARVEIISVHRSKDLAEKNRAMLASINKHDGYKTFIELDNGKEMQIHVPWTGYFESLTELHCEEFIIEKE